MFGLLQLSGAAESGAVTWLMQFQSLPVMATSVATSYIIQTPLATGGMLIHLLSSIWGATTSAALLYSDSNAAKLLQPLHRRHSTFSESGRRVDRQTVRSEHFPSRNTPRHLSSGPRPRNSFMSWLSRASVCQLLQ